MSCDLCGAASLERVYVARNSARNLTVSLCAHCGLLQSPPSGRRAARLSAANATGTGWSNSRNVKAARAEANLSTLMPFLSKNNTLRVLDVGAGRGTFALELKSAYPNSRIIGIEPDDRVVAGWAGKPGFMWLKARPEDTRLENDGFDLIYSCHTLQHLESARRTLFAHRAALAPGGYLLVEVPNVALLSADDIVEEFFVDNHRYHFSARTLARLLAACGLRAISIADPRDDMNITIVAVKADSIPAQTHADPREVEAAAALISAYNASRLKNVAALMRVAGLIDAMAPRKVAVWGAGRLLNSLIAHGGLRPQALSAVIDKHHARHANQAHGVRLMPPRDFARVDADVVVVMSRSLAAEIRDEAHARAPGCEVIAYADLLTRAA